MMDDLASPLERALIAYNRVERSLLHAPMRTLAPALGGALLMAALTLALLIATASGEVLFTSTGAALHGTLALIGLALGAGWLLRKAWAVLALYPVVALLQAMPYLVLPAQLFRHEHVRQVAWAALGVESLVLIALAGLIRQRDRALEESGEY